MASFQTIYDSCAAPLYRFLLSLSGSEDMARELLQETFYRALRSIDKFEGRSSVYTWLCQIGKNVWLKECRRRQRYRPLEDAEGAPSPEEEIVARDECRRIRLALEGLEEPYREVFVLHAVGGVKLKEIADIFGKSESWARVTYFRTKQKITLEVSK